MFSPSLLSRRLISPSFSQIPGIWYYIIQYKLYSNMMKNYCILIRVVMFILPESSSFWNFTISLSANIVQFSLYKIFNSSVIFHSVFTVLARNSFAIRSWRFSCTPKLKTMDFPSRPSIVLESPLATSFWEPKKVFPQFEWRRNVVEDVMGPKIIQSWLLICVRCVAIKDFGIIYDVCFIKTDHFLPG